MHAALRPSDALASNRAEIRRIVHANRASNPRVFGSTARGEDEPGSDLDLLIEPSAATTYFHIAHIALELEALLGVPVDVVTPKALSPRVRAKVLAEARPV